LLNGQEGARRRCRASPSWHRQYLCSTACSFIHCWQSLSRREGAKHARNPTPNPKQSRTIQRLRSAPCPQALRSARDAWRPRGLLSEETAHTPRKAHKQGAERSHMHGGMHGDSLFAAAGSAPERSSLLAHRRSPKLISEIKKKKPKPTTNKTPNPELGPS
jgi:hypothetical protein